MKKKLTLIFLLVFNTALPVNVHSENNLDQISQTVWRYLIGYFSDSNKDALEPLAHIEVNRIKQIEAFGIKYEIDYELLLDVKEDIYITDGISLLVKNFKHTFSYLKRQPNSLGKKVSTDIKKINAGSKILATGIIYIKVTGNNYKVLEFNNQSYTTYSEGSMSLDKFFLRKKLIDEYKTEGDYYETDIPEITLYPKYYLAKHVPIVQSIVNELSINVSDQCADCRNDNIQDIDKSIKYFTLAYRRYTPVDEVIFNESPNKGWQRYQIKNITYKFRGITDDGKSKGFMCQIDYSFEFEEKIGNEMEFFNSTYEIAYSKTGYVYPDKQTAFDSALNSIRSQVNNLINKYQSIALHVEKIIPDKKGNPKYLLAEKAPDMFYKSRVKFYIVKKESVKIEGNILNIGNVIGKAVFVYKGNGRPEMIKLQIKKRKTRKALKKYKEKQLLLISVP